METTYGDNIIERNGWFSFLYTVPLEYVDKNGGKRQIRKSLRTRDREKAKRLAIMKRAECMMQYETDDVEEVKEVLIDVAKATAKRFGFIYENPKILHDASPQDFVALSSLYVEAREKTPRPNRAEVATFSAAVEVPSLPMSKAFAMFKKIAPDTVADMNHVDAAQRWRKYERSFEDFVKHMGDLDALKITPADVSAYRNSLYTRITEGEFKSEYANKHMGNIRLVLDAVLDVHHRGTENSFAKFKRIKMKDAGKKEAMNEDDVRAVREKLATSNMSDEAKAMIVVTQNTDAGIKELCGLAPDDIVLDGDYSHIKLRPNAYRKYLKTDERERELPLVGEALEAMKKFPNGFERYRYAGGPLSANNAFYKFFRTVTPGKSFGSYRHRIAELMRNSECKDQHQNAVMGHATPGMTGYYGGKVWLENMQKALMEALPEDNR